MAHFAKIDENKIVENVIVINNSDCGDFEFPESEVVGQLFINSLGLTGVWKQTSYNNNFRKNYAGVGYSYDESRDAFIPIKPYPSYVLNEDTCQWEPPVPRPNDGKFYDWDEDNLMWKEFTNNWEPIN
jgi:hypothetical protein